MAIAEFLLWSKRPDRLVGLTRFSKMGRKANSPPLGSHSTRSESSKCLFIFQNSHSGFFGRIQTPATHTNAHALCFVHLAVLCKLIVEEQRVLQYCTVKDHLHLLNIVLKLSKKNVSARTAQCGKGKARTCKTASGVPAIRLPSQIG